MRWAWARRIASRFVRGIMITIEFTAPSTARLQFAAGDRITVRTLTPELQTLLNGQRLDGSTVARVVRGGDEVAVTDETRETATIRHGRATRSPTA